MGSAGPSPPKVAGRSFAGTAEAEPEWMLHWALGPELADFDEPRRLPTMTFMMSFPLLPATIILGATDPEGALQVASC